MKRIVLYLLVACTVIGAGYAINAKRKVVVAEEPTIEGVRQKVKLIYDHVCQSYPDIPEPDADGDFEEGGVPEENFDSLYCTEAWNKVLNAVIEKDNSETADFIGFFEKDYWIMGQDWDHVHYDSVNVTAFNRDSATVTFNLYNFDHVHHIELVMRYENNEWRIDNIKDLGVGDDPEASWGIDMRLEMEAYLAE